MSNNIDQEARFLQGLRAGENLIFKQIFYHYYKLLVAIGYKILEDRDLAESVVQDVFANLWNNRERAEIASLKGYLIVSVRNRALNEIKRAKRFVDYSNDSRGIESHSQIEYQPDYDLIEHIMKCLDELPEQRRKIFKMNRLEGLKYHEIASELNLSVKTIEAQMSKALAFVRERLAGYRYLAVMVGLLLVK